MAKLSKQAKRVQKARTLLMVFFPFYGTLLANLELIEAKAVGPQIIDTMATDGRHVFFNPEFVDELYDDEVLFVLAHEAGHCANLHHTRRGDRDPTEWNIAGDYVLNIDLIKAGVGRMPKGGLLDHAYDGWSTEQVYEARQQQKRQQQQQQQGKGKSNDAQQKSSSRSQSQSQQSDASQKPGKASSSPGKQGAQSDTGNGQTPATGQPDASQGQGDPGRCGQVLDAVAADGSSSPADKAEQEADWQRITRQAISVAKRAAGSTPAYCERLLGELNTSREDWRAVMRRFVDQSTNEDYAFSRPDRRFAGADFILPSLYSETIEHIVDVIDASGSIDDTALKCFVSESQAMLDQGLVKKLTIVVHDTSVRSVHEFTPGDVIDVQIIGGGGTKFRPVWEWLAQQQDQISGVVWFTDLETGDGFGDEPSVPVLWAAYGNPASLERRMKSVPFGECVVVGD